MTTPRNPKSPMILIDDIDQKAILKALASLVVFLGIVAALLTLVDSGESATLGPTPDVVEPTDAAGQTTSGNTTDETDTPAGPNDPESASPNPGQVTTGVTSGTGGTDGGSGGSGSQVVEPTSPPVDPCVAVLEAGDAVLVSPDPMTMPSGDMTAELTLTNCTEEAVAWTAATKPWVELAHTSGSLSAGSSSPLGFTVDSGAIQPGAFEFRIKVSTPGANTYVDVDGFRPSFGTDFIDPDMGLTAGVGAGGCSNDCITRAWLTPQLMTPNVSLEMTTNVPTKMWVFLSTEAPQMIDGRPAFPGVTPTVFNNSFETSMTELLSPLEADTKYHIIVKATDENDNSQWETSSFTTRTPATGPTDFAGPGCELQCIIKALVHTTDDAGTVTIDVATIVPAGIEIFVSDTHFAYDETGTKPLLGGEPTVSNGDDLDKTWSTTVAGLEPGTKHHIAVRATDSDGDVSVMVGTFTTAEPAPVDLWITLHEVRITHDGDPSLGNRGEITVGWGVNDDFVASISEQKLKDGAVVEFDPFHRTYVFEDISVDSFLPFVRVWAIERDADGISGFCSIGSGVVTEPGSSNACDRTWNASEPAGLHLVENIDQLGDCSALGLGAGFDDHGCLVLESVGGLSDQYVRFEAIVSFGTSES